MQPTKIYTIYYSRHLLKLYGNKHTDKHYTSKHIDNLCNYTCNAYIRALLMLIDLSSEWVKVGKQAQQISENTFAEFRQTVIC
jgi:hypothetical protein